MAVKDRKRPLVFLSMKDCMVSRNEVTWVSHIIRTHRIRCKFMVPPSSLNANPGTRIGTLLENQVLAISVWTEIGFVKIPLVESSYNSKMDLLIIKS